MYVGNVQLWAKGLKDQWLLPAMKDGTFKFNNPQRRRNSITLPINVVIAGTEGTSLVAAMEMNGQRHGKPLTYARMTAKVSGRVPKSRTFAVGHPGDQRLANTVSAAKGPGVSEEFVKAIPTSSLYLLGPYDQDEMKAIANQHLTKLAARMLGGNEIFGRTTLLWSDAVTELLATYNSHAEDGALGIAERVRTLIKESLGRSGAHRRVRSILDARRNRARRAREPDRTRSLVVRFAPDAQNAGDARDRDRAKRCATARARPSQTSASTNCRPSITASTRKSSASSRSFASERQSLSIANAATGAEPQPATVLMMDGWTSTAKRKPPRNSRPNCCRGRKSS